MISDEATMKTNHAFSASNFLFHKVIKNNLPRGGKVLLLGGDCCQCLLVVRHEKKVKVPESYHRKQQ